MSWVSDSVEIHSAWVWQCDCCGRENFTRGLEGDIYEPAIEHAGPQKYLICFHGCDGECEHACDGEMNCLGTRIVADPCVVECRYCGREFFTEVWCREEEDDEE